ncbi:hypothetical protein [Streptomyces sp. B21-106]|uniref:hypothetical protein n=1 Tax=Streptomyces sp. B21-106 TaxID=3039418 RepID=UPI002FEFB133
MLADPHGFAIPPPAPLTWTGHRDTFWLTCLCAATLVGTAVARIGHARAAYRRVASAVTTATDPEDEPDIV